VAKPIKLLIIVALPIILAGVWYWAFSCKMPAIDPNAANLREQAEKASLYCLEHSGLATNKPGQVSLAIEYYGSDTYFSNGLVFVKLHITNNTSGKLKGKFAKAAARLLVDGKEYPTFWYDTGYTEEKYILPKKAVAPVTSLGFYGLDAFNIWSQPGKHTIALKIGEDVSNELQFNIIPGPTNQTPGVGVSLPMPPRLVSAFKSLFATYYPDAVFITKSNECSIEYKPQVYTVASKDKSGQPLPVQKQKGPGPGGIGCSMWYGSGKLEAPLNPGPLGSIRQNGKSELFSIYPYSVKCDTHLQIYLAYPKDVNEEFFQRFRDLAVNFESYITN
jgi:hypothetical protein